MEKQIREWLKELPEEMEARVIKYAAQQDRSITREVRSLRDALNLSMCWSETPEGHHYWEEMVRGGKPIPRRDSVIGISPDDNNDLLLLTMGG